MSTWLFVEWAESLSKHNNKKKAQPVALSFSVDKESVLRDAEMLLPPSFLGMDAAFRIPSSCWLFKIISAAGCFFFIIIIFFFDYTMT